MLAKSTKYVRAALGLHPQIVGEFHYEVEALCELIPETRYVGEIGLDGSPEYIESFALQKSVLDQILLSCAANGGRIISLHSRNATSEVLNMLEKHKTSGTAILHWFSGNLKELERAIHLGCWFSVGPAMLKSKKGKELLANMPCDRILTETDGPFVQKEGKAYMPWQVVDVEKQVSNILGVDLKTLNSQILSNLHTLTKTGPEKILKQ